MKLRISCVSDVGCFRDNNEDLAAVGESLIRDGSLDMDKEIRGDEPFCILVSDGMGGHESGEYASQYTLESLRDFLQGQPGGSQDPAPDLKKRIEEISADLNRKASELRQGKAMGCTLSGLVWMRGKVLLVNVGDSRTYRLRDGEITQLTSDQTIHERDKVPLPVGKSLYNCIGAFCDTSAFVLDISDSLTKSDRILVCSDGLSDMLEDRHIERILSEGTPEESVAALVGEAKSHGGLDNVTVIAADVLKM